MNRRARLTIVDVLYIAFALAGLAALYPVYMDVYGSTAPMLDTGPDLLFGTAMGSGEYTVVSRRFVFDTT